MNETSFFRTGGKVMAEPTKLLPYHESVVKHLDMILHGTHTFESSNTEWLHGMMKSVLRLAEDTAVPQEHSDMFLAELVRLKGQSDVRLHENFDRAVAEREHFPFHVAAEHALEQFRDGLEELANLTVDPAETAPEERERFDPDAGKEKAQQQAYESTLYRMSAGIAGVTGLIIGTIVPREHLYSLHTSLVEIVKAHMKLGDSPVIGLNIAIAEIEDRIAEAART